MPDTFAQKHNDPSGEYLRRQEQNASPNKRKAIGHMAAALDKVAQSRNPADGTAEPTLNIPRPPNECTAPDQGRTRTAWIFIEAHKRSYRYICVFYVRVEKHCTLAIWRCGWFCLFYASHYNHNIAKRRYSLDSNGNAPVSCYDLTSYSLFIGTRCIFLY